MREHFSKKFWKVFACGTTKCQANTELTGISGQLLCAQQAPKLFSAQLRSLSFVLVAQSPLIHSAARAMSKATDLSTLMTKRLETDCAWRIGPWDNNSDKLDD